MSLGLEGELPSGDDPGTSRFRRDARTTRNRSGSVRLTTYRQMHGVAELRASDSSRSESGQRRLRRKHPDLHVGSSDHARFDCRRTAPDAARPLKNEREMTQNIWRPISSATSSRCGTAALVCARFGLSREQLQFRAGQPERNAHLPRPIAGTFPNDGQRRRVRRLRALRRAADPDHRGWAAGRRAFQRRARRPRLGLEHGAMPNLETYKALDRLGRSCRATGSVAASTARSVRRTWASSSSGARRSSAQRTAYGDQCSQNSAVGPFSATPRYFGSQRRPLNATAICRR